jgi:exonuclease III
MILRDVSNLNSEADLNDFFVLQRDKITFSLLYTNIRSLRKNFNNFITEINDILPIPDFLVLSEIWIDQDEINLFKIPGYNAYFKCNNSYRAGGVLCYIKE